MLTCICIFIDGSASPRKHHFHLVENAHHRPYDCPVLTYTLPLSSIGRKNMPKELEKLIFNKNFKLSDCCTLQIASI